MIVHVKIAAVARKFLFDNGVEVNFIEQLLRKQKSTAFQSSKNSVEIANEIKKRFSEYINPVEVYINSYKEKCTCRQPRKKLWYNAWKLAAIFS